MGRRSPSGGRTNAIAQVQGRPKRALGIVAMGGRQAEDRHHRVADELLDGPAVLGDDVPGHGVVARQQRAEILRIERLTKGRRAAHIGEEDRDEPSLLAHCVAMRRWYGRRSAVATPRLTAGALRGLRRRR
jgi:hypothetical protein